MRIERDHRSGVGFGHDGRGRASSLYSLIFTDPTSTVSIRVTRSIFCDAAVPHISESTDRVNALKVVWMAPCQMATARTEDLVRLPEAKRGGIHGHQLPICF